jgi:hypothetical protein
MGGGRRRGQLPPRKGPIASGIGRRKAERFGIEELEDGKGRTCFRKQQQSESFRPRNFLTEPPKGPAAVPNSGSFCLAGCSWSWIWRTLEWMEEMRWGNIARLEGITEVSERLAGRNLFFIVCLT